MTDNPEKPINSDEPQADLVLQSLVVLANSSEIGFAVTLCMSGIVVSGLIVSGKTFFEGVAKEALANSVPGDQTENSQAVSDYLGNFGKLMYQRTENEEGSGSESDETFKRLPSFIHLQDAKFFHNSGKPMPANRGLWWRGRISAVDGFNFGSFAAS